MSKFKSDKVMPRYFAIAVVLTLIGFAVVGKAMYIMTAEKEYWTKVADRLKRDSVSVKPSRGNILSCDGQLMASSIPEYKVYMDFQAGRDDSIHAQKQDSIWEEKIDSICEGLSQIFPSKTADEFKTHLIAGKSGYLRTVRKARATTQSGHAASTITLSARYVSSPFSKNRYIREASTGKNSMPVDAHLDHWLSVPLVTCSEQKIARNMV